MNPLFELVSVSEKPTTIKPYPVKYENGNMANVLWNGERWVCEPEVRKKIVGWFRPEGRLKYNDLIGK